MSLVMIKLEGMNVSWLWSGSGRERGKTIRMHFEYNGDNQPYHH